MGEVLDVYWDFSKPGGHYLGRILAGMDPKKPSLENCRLIEIFGNPMKNEDAASAMDLLFGTIL